MLDLGGALGRIAVDDGVHFVIVFGVGGGVADGDLVDGMAEDDGGVDEASGIGLEVTAFDEGDGIGHRHGLGLGLGLGW